MVEDSRNKYPHHARILGGMEHFKFEIHKTQLQVADFFDHSQPILY
jgi:hypothetical protein